MSTFHPLSAADAERSIRLSADQVMLSIALSAQDASVSGVMLVSMHMRMLVMHVVLLTLRY